MKLTHDYTHDIAARYKWMQLLLILVAVLLLGRLYYLQIVRGEDYRRFSQEYSIREVAVPAPRGLIIDRNGKVLASNQPTLDLVAIPQYVQDWARVRESLAHLLQISPESLDAAWAKRKGKAAYQPITLASNLSLDAVSRLKAHKTPWYFTEDPYDLRGVEIEPRATRRYSDGALAPHLLGYLKESDDGVMVGASGIEAAYDDILQGTPGSRDRVVNAMGRVVDYPSVEARLTHRKALPGATLQSTIDSRLQAAARKGFGGRSGALVALDPMTGEILALYSSPTFDLSQLNSQVMTDAGKPLYNRAVQGAYPPGSTYKMVTALAGLSEGVIQPDETVLCRGGMEIGGRRFGCWNKGGHGAVDLTRAIAESCDVYFYTIGIRLGLDRLAKYANALGLGKKTQIDIPNERSGLIPTNEWKSARFGREGTNADAAMASIGQGFDLLTPLQDALMVARMVNRGKTITPHVVKSPLPPGEGQGEGAFNSTHLALIRKGMENVVNAPGGTARHLASLNLKIAGKTGTAQTVGYDSKAQQRDHAWFVGYAPYDDPKIVVAAIVEYAGHGGTAAAPVVGEVIKAYLQEKTDASTR
jgi:penicillin-binding protein 2